MAFQEQLFEHPFSMIIAGPSKAGKTVFTAKLLKHIDTLATVSPTEILWCLFRVPTKLSFFGAGFS